MYRSTNNQQKLGRPPLLTVLNMVKVVFVLSESSKLKNHLICSIFSTVTLTRAVSSTPSESRFTCTVVRPFGIVAIGIRAARV